MEKGRNRTYLLKACSAFLLNSLRSAFRVAAEKRTQPNVYSAQFQLLYILAVKVHIV